MSELFKRLKLIQTCISLEDHYLIELQLPVLQALSCNEQVLEIISLLEQQEYLESQQLIEDWLHKQQSLVLYEDDKTAAIRLELKVVEQKLQSLLLQRDEAHNRLQDFNRQYHLKLGPILKRILSLQEEVAAQKLALQLNEFRRLFAEFSTRNNQLATLKTELQSLDEQLCIIDFLSENYGQILAQYNSKKQSVEMLEAERETIRQTMLREFNHAKQAGSYSDYQQAHNQANSFEQENEDITQKIVEALTKDEIKALKKAYRKASMLCHPDLVGDALKKHAHQLMVQLNEAYASQNLSKVLELLSQIERGERYAAASNSLTTFEMLFAKLEELKYRHQQVGAELNSLQESDEYKTILDLGEFWDNYFETQHIALSELAFLLEEELAGISSDKTTTAYELYASDTYDSSVTHEVTGFWRRGHWRDGYRVRGHWVKGHTRGDTTQSL
ncbi:hypothetical protein MSG37_02630 [Shewanella sp. 1CM18E]|uniref:J domain-containing protein n=1 Tax=Shewanella sp. 1CM18E TaxID=2929169 RepID=UPI0020C0C8CC|nr:J domain-containing protein [Shewanella sp. 1CM18E]MCK8043767.1 hypothetical protein [Shewanella sp. 1CM18E]